MSNMEISLSATAFPHRLVNSSLHLGESKATVRISHLGYSYVFRHVVPSRLRSEGIRTENNLVEFLEWRATECETAVLDNITAINKFRQLRTEQLYCKNRQYHRCWRNFPPFTAQESSVPCSKRPDNNPEPNKSVHTHISHSSTTHFQSLTTVFMHYTCSNACYMFRRPHLFLSIYLTKPPVGL
jgi:hypothetical protein